MATKEGSSNTQPSQTCNAVYVVEAVPYDNPDAFTLIDSVWAARKPASKRQSDLQATREFYGVRVVTRRVRRG